MEHIMNQKTITIIPDLHGRTFWKKAMKAPESSHVVFLGDYLDPYRPSIFDVYPTTKEEDDLSPEAVIENFKEILEFKKSAPDRVTLLLGNHDGLAVTPLDVFIGALDDINYPVIAFERTICLCPVIILVAISCVIARDIVAIGAGTAIVATSGQAESESKRQADRQDLRESSEFATHWDSLPPTGASFSVT